ncbi:MAG: UvrD-helicase domain-containing protein [Candidatus Kerfeldbacteria bacterium]
MPKKKATKKAKPKKSTPKKNTGRVSKGDLILKELNEMQREAAEATEGPVLVLAGAGSGKTRTLIHRTAYLIAEKGVKPWTILAVTFTNKAAQNMKERMSALLGDMKHTPVMGTFHSICARLLRKEIPALGFERNFVIYGDDDQKGLVKKIMKEMGYDTKQIPANSVHWKISSAKNLLIGPEEFEQLVDDPISEVAAKVYPKYQEELHKANALDFDDLIMKTVELFQQFPEILAKYQKMWKYILVDEYQDTNKAQYTLVSLLADDNKNICVVGDDFQSIYSWRMADIRNILDFEKDYPDATVVLLEQNYRSTQTILDASNAVIAKNKNQKKKVLWTENDLGEKIIVNEVEDQEAEGRFIVEQIINIETGDGKVAGSSTPELKYENDEYAQPDPADQENMQPIQEGESILERVMRSKMFEQNREAQDLQQKVDANKKAIDFSRYVVLYRTNAQSRAIEEAFLKYNIPYKIIGGIRFYERMEIKDAIAYLRVMFNPADWVALERISNTPARGIGDRTWIKIEQFAAQRGFNIVEAAGQAIPDIQNARLSAFYQFAEIIKTVRDKMEELNPTEILDMVLKEIGYKEHLFNTTETKEKAEAKWENVQELKNVTQKFANLRGAEGLEAFLEEVSLVMDQDNVDESENVVKLMTVHAAKGLEFPVVFVVGMEEGLFPHSRSLIDPKEMEEERRLCYVALTRAIERVYLVLASQRMRWGNVQVNPPSRFIDDIPDELMIWLQ